MSNEIRIFENKEFGEIRTIEINGESWFVGKDIAEILGYSNASKAVSTHVDDDDKTFLMLNIADSQNGNLPMGQTRTAIINESGLYSLILSSKLPKAKEFKHWITSEILPTIRKTGEYSIQRKLDSYMIEDPIKRAERWIEEQKEKLALKIKIEQDKPLVDFANHVSNTSDLIDIQTLAKITKKENINIGRNRLFEWLRNNKYLIDHGVHKNEPYQQYINQGYFVVREYVYDTAYGLQVGTKTYITGKGQIYIIEKLRKEFCN